MSLEKNWGVKVPGPRKRAETFVHLACLFSTFHVSYMLFILCYKIIFKAFIL